MNALIVDDNKMARIALMELAGRIDDLTIVAECSGAFEAYNLLLSESIDLLLLDIEMPGMSGFELTKNLTPKRPVIIFITSRKEYAPYSLELNVVDYTLKPVPFP